MAKVNLDALIPREDFDIESKNNNETLIDRLKIDDLIFGSAFYSSLRKPDFQRETADWDKSKITSFIQSFIEGDLIPSIILWSSGEYVFVIDGAHRLSALIAWANDDFGDGVISHKFFNNNIDPDQKKISEQARRNAHNNIGAYSTYKSILLHTDTAMPDKLQIARKLGKISLQLQWVPGNADKAENSFYTINQKGSVISDTEMSLLKKRRKPYAIASRAIIRSGNGHKYWNKFDTEKQSEIERYAKIINENLFSPKFNNPIKTLDLPIAGKSISHTSLALIFDTVKLANKIDEKGNQDGNNKVSDDTTGENTVKYLKNTARIIRRLTTTHPSSLGLHPAVYFYSEKGRYQPTAFMAWVVLMNEFEKTNLLKEFSDVREEFEKTLINYKFLTNQITNKYGSKLKSYNYLIGFYKNIFECVKNGNSFENEIKIKFPFLNIDYKGDEIKSRDFSSITKSEIFINEAINKAPKCSICGGLLHVNSISIDHVNRKEDGGIGDAENGQLTHPYCNSTIKN